MEIIYMHEDAAPKQNLTIYSYVMRLSDQLYNAVVITVKDDDPVDVTFTGRDAKQVINKCKSLVDWALHQYVWEN